MKPASYFWGLLLLPATAAAAEEGGLKLLSFSTLIGEIIAFALFVAFVMKFVWPPLMNLIETRQKEIADGLAAAEQGRQELADADTQRSQILAQAREQSGEMVSDGEKRGHAVLEAARRDAENEKARIIELGKREVDAERIAMRREIEEKLGTLIVAGAEKILQREVDAAVHQDIVDSMKKTL